MTADTKECEDTFDWTLQWEMTLYRAMMQHKPAGISRHFKMACLVNELNQAPLSKPAPTPQQIWRYLEELYNLEGIDELESQCETDMLKENDFFLPDGTYSRLMHAREEESNLPNNNSTKRRRTRRDSAETVSSSRASTPATRTSDTKK